jgi:hypothetical protein
MAFTYPLSFTGTLWRVINGDIYVSYLGSDVSGTGSPRKPYKTIQRAINVASAGSKIVVGTGNYDDAVNGLAKNCKLTADATVSMRGLPSRMAFSNMGTGCTIQGFTIEGYGAAVDGVISEVSYCYIQSPLTTFGGTVKFSVLSNITFNGSGPIRFINCTLVGVASASPSAITRLESCHLGDATNIQTSTLALTYFDYCNQQPGSIIQINATPYTDHTQVTSGFPSFQVNGKSLPPFFNQPLIGDYTLATSSPIKTAGRNGTPIGARNEAVKLGVAQILSGGSLSGITINQNGFMEIPETVFTGIIVTPVIDLGAVRPVRTIRLYAEQLFDEATFRVVSFNNDSYLPGAITFELRYADEEPDVSLSNYESMIWDMSPSHDHADYSNGDVTFKVTSSTFITTRYVQLRITLRNAEDILLLAQENGSLLLQEDEHQIQI